ncbi:hypothetical protein [Serratia marcescens]|uniref:hypothetical protein n=1 Tax=Serratia marcescens TaxID=615 RepID=UPI001F149E1E|nr:hypothetical protein [Serratia marcescens]
MKTYLVPIIMKTETRGHISIVAESMEQAKAVKLSQEQIALVFQSHFVNTISYDFETNINNQNY